MLRAWGWKLRRHYQGVPKRVGVSIDTLTNLPCISKSVLIGVQVWLRMEGLVPPNGTFLIAQLFWRAGRLWRPPHIGKWCRRNQVNAACAGDTRTRRGAKAFGSARTRSSRTQDVRHSS